MKGTNWLANIFSWIHLVVEEADKPISLLVQVFLPFVAPLLPALITANSLGVFMNLIKRDVTIGYPKNQRRITDDSRKQIPRAAWPERGQAPV